jgi:hypothetical protein
MSAVDPGSYGGVRGADHNAHDLIWGVRSRSDGPGQVLPPSWLDVFAYESLW